MVHPSVLTGVGAMGSRAKVVTGSSRARSMLRVQLTICR